MALRLPGSGNRSTRRFVVVGGGPAGLTAAYELARLQFRPVLFEKLPSLGGPARTESYKGFLFDMGGHRFFTKAASVQRVWEEVLGTEFLLRPRLSRIFYKGSSSLTPCVRRMRSSGSAPWKQRR